MSAPSLNQEPPTPAGPTKGAPNPIILVLLVSSLSMLFQSLFKVYGSDPDLSYPMCRPAGTIQVPIQVFLGMGFYLVAF